MTAETGHNLGLVSGWVVGSSGWGPAMDANIRFLDGVVEFTAAVAPLSTPPGSPALGDRYIVGASASGAWSGQDKTLAVYQKDESNTSAWAFYTPKEGWVAKILDASMSVLPVTYLYRGGSWIVKSEVAAILGLTGAVTLSDLLGAGLGSAATETVPGAGLVRSDGTHFATATIGANLTLSGAGVLDLKAITAGFVYSNGSTLVQGVLGAHFTGASGTLDIVALPTLDTSGANSGRVPMSMLPAQLSEAEFYAGTLDGGTGIVSGGGTLVSSTGTAGATYKVTTAGTHTLNGISQWNVGDRAVYNGDLNLWEKIDGISTEVLSVAGRAGAVVLTLGADLTDVVITTPASGDFVQYNGTNWVNATITLTEFSGPGIMEAPFSGAALQPVTIGYNLVYTAPGTLGGSGRLDVHVPSGPESLVYTDGTVLTATALGSNLQLIGGILSTINLQDTGQKDFANGYAGLDGNGFVPLADIQPNIVHTDLAIPLIGKPAGYVAGPPVVGRTTVLLQQTLTLKANLSNTGLKFTEAPTGTPAFVLSNWHNGTITPRGTLTVNSGNTLTVTGAGTIDVDIPPGDFVMIDNPATQDATAANGCVTIRFDKKAG